MPTELRRDRRDFLRLCGRCVMLALGGWAVARQRIARSVPGNERCRNGWICSECNAYRACKLPPALSRRKALESRTAAPDAGKERS